MGIQIIIIIIIIIIIYWIYKKLPAANQQIVVYM